MLCLSRQLDWSHVLSFRPSTSGAYLAYVHSSSPVPRLLIHHLLVVSFTSALFISHINSQPIFADDSQIHLFPPHQSNLSVFISTFFAFPSCVHTSRFFLSFIRLMSPNLSIIHLCLTLASCLVHPVPQYYIFLLQQLPLYVCVCVFFWSLRNSHSAQQVTTCSRFKAAAPLLQWGPLCSRGSDCVSRFSKQSLYCTNKTLEDFS